MHAMTVPCGASEKEKTTRNAVLAGLIDTVITGGAMVASNSSVLLADFSKTLLEFLAVAMAWQAMRLVRKGGGHRFEYGLDRLETLSSLFVGLLMVLILVLIVLHAVRNLLHPEAIKGWGVWLSMGSQVVYGFINSYFWMKNRRGARHSPLMASQARLFQSKAFANGFILLSLTLSTVFDHQPWADAIDPSASIVIAGFILMAALGVVSSSFMDLLDCTLEEQSQILILRELARHFEDYKDLHGIRSRKSGSKVYIEVFLEFEPHQSFAEIQPIADDICRGIEAAIPDSSVTIGLASGRVA